MDRRTFLQNASATAAALSLPSTLLAARPAAARRPNLLFIMADQWRRPAFSYTGQEPVKTPNLDLLAAHSVVFNRAYCTVALCSPSRSSMVTGLFAQTTGVLTVTTPLRKDTPTIAHPFNDAGYSTGYIGKWHLGGGGPLTPVAPDLRGGFQYWLGSECSHHNFQMEHTDTAGNLVNTKGYVPDLETGYAIDFIQKNKARPFFLFLSWAPPHPGTALPTPTNYEPMEEVYSAPKADCDLYHDVLPTRPNVSMDFDSAPHTRHVLSNPGVPPAAGYYGAIAAIDRNVGKLLATLDAEGLRDNTIVVFTSDHGEMMMSHALFGKKVFWEESIGVPFMVSWPGVIKPAHCDELFNGPDIAPTLTALAGLKMPQPVEGRDFSPALHGQAFTGPDATFSAYFDEQRPDVPTIHSWRCIRTKNYSYAVIGSIFPAQAAKYVAGTKVPVTRHLFDMEADPYQLHPIDVAKEGASIAAELGVKLRAHLTAHNDFFAQLV